MANADQITTIPATNQQAEIQVIQEKYGTEVKIIRDVGDFTNVVIIRPAAVDIVIKFQLTAAYPMEKPGVIVRSDSIAVDSMPEIMELVNRTTRANGRCPVIDLVTGKILQHLRENGLDTPPEVTTVTKKSGKGGAKRKGKKKGKKAPVDEGVKDEKKPSMKTADDVVKRILWDEKLPTDLFHIGYLDRFKGVMERSFSSFSWEDLASVDIDVLAIPKHRIQYFKYKDVIVWDKNKRVDYVYGSVGKTVTIHDVMDNYELYLSLQKKDQKDAPNSTNEVQDNLDSDDDDDDIEIDFGHQANAYGDYTLQDERLRPNHFFCVRITDEEILEGIDVIQDCILEHEPRYASCCISSRALHLTLATVGLDNEEQRANAARVLAEFRDKLHRLDRNSLELRLEGVDNFFNRVVYARAHHDMAFTEFVNHFRASLVEGGVEIRDNYDYTPHVTIMKTTRPVSRELNTPKVNTNLYSHFSDMYFGKQFVDGIYLCEMTDQRRPDGFYVTHGSINV